jgi:hypothetical protein
MRVNRDFRDLFAALNDAGAEYLIVGAHALAAHGHVRATKDIDVWVRCDPENATRVYRALQVFGASLASLTATDLATPGIIFQIGVAPVRIDILTVISGVTFEEAWPARVRARYGDQDIAVLSREHLIQNKLASGRLQDLADVERLRGKPE